MSCEILQPVREQENDMNKQEVSLKGVPVSLTLFVVAYLSYRNSRNRY